MLIWWGCLSLSLSLSLALSVNKGLLCLFEYISKIAVFCVLKCFDMTSLSLSVSKNIFLLGSLFWRPPWLCLIYVWDYQITMRLWHHIKATICTVTSLPSWAGLYRSELPSFVSNTMGRLQFLDPKQNSGIFQTQTWIGRFNLITRTSQCQSGQLFVLQTYLLLVTRSTCC